jgi:hypothetical protein
LLRKLLGFSGLHFKLLRRLFLSEHGRASSQFTFFALNRVASKLARETPEAEAASLVTWMDGIDGERAVDEDYWDRFLDIDNLADKMSELSTSANGRHALAAAGACEVVVDIMLRNHLHSVEGCQERSSRCMTGKCECENESCDAHRCCVRAILLISCCREGSLRLHRTEWNQNWPVVLRYISDCKWKLQKGECLELVDDLIVKLSTKSPEPMILHSSLTCAGQDWCLCGKLLRDCKITNVTPASLQRSQVIIPGRHYATHKPNARPVSLRAAP